MTALLAVTAPSHYQRSALTWAAMRPKHRSPPSLRQPGLVLPLPMTGVACVAFGLGAAGAAWIDRLTSSEWFAGLAPGPEDLPDEITARGSMGVPAAPVAAIAIPRGSSPDDLDTATALIETLRHQRGAHGCRTTVLVTLDETVDAGRERQMLEHGAVVVRAGNGAGDDHLHHLPLRASTRPREGRLVCVDLADYLAAWRAGRRATLHVIPMEIGAARGAIEGLRPGRVPMEALTLEFHLADDDATPLAAIDALACMARDRFLSRGAPDMVFTSADRLDGRTGTADLLLIEAGF